MPQTLSQVYLHIVFATKNRQRFLEDPAVRSRLHAYLAGLCRHHRCPALVVGGTADHVYMLCRLTTTLSMAALLADAKRASSPWAKQQSPELAAFQWQAGCGVFSVGPGDVEDVSAYISSQEAHHRTRGFQEEYRALLQAHGVEWAERYVWD